MNWHFGKLGLLLFVVLLCIAAAGIGYAAWSEGLDIAGSVTTGSDDPGFVGNCTFNNSPDSSNPDPDAQCVCDFVDEDGDGDCEKVDVTITKANAFHWYKLYLPIENNGSIPVRITDVVVTYSSPAYVSEEETLFGTVLDAGAQATCKLVIEIGEAPDRDYNFSVTIAAAQWSQ